MSINTELTALADAIRVKSGTGSKLSISGMTTAVNSITTGIDIDLSGVTVTADKMLSGIVAIGTTGEKVTGNIPTVTASSDGEKVTVPVGYIASEQSFDIGSDGYDTSAVTVTADTMLAGKIAVGKNGETITGNIATVTPNLSGRTFTVAKGYVAENFESSVPEATVTETESKVTISVGYVSSELSYDLGGIDTTTSVPPSAADVRLGKEFWANGEKYTGTMPDAVVTVETFDGGEYTHKLTISAGFLENDFELEYNTSAVVSLPFVTATAADIREGKVGADNEGNPVYGTLVVGGDTPVYTSSVIYRCTELVSHPDDIIVSAGTWLMKGFKENALVATEVERAFSLVGTYKLVDPSATGRLRYWTCNATEPCIVDGQQYNSAKIDIYFVYDHGTTDAAHTEIDSWCIFVEEADGFRYMLLCQDQDTDAVENSPDEVTNWTEGCRHISARPTFPDLEYTQHSITGTPPVMSLRGGDAVWAGDALKFSNGEWSSTGEAPVQLTASGYAPIVGKSYTADTGALATLYPDAAGEPEVENEVGVVKVTEFIPYSPAFRGVTAVDVSGIGYVGNKDEDFGADHSEANGRYSVTEDTYYEEDEKKRIYKHETKNYWIKFYDDTENEWYGSSYWVITSYESDNDPYSAILCYAGDLLQDGFNQWESLEYETSHGINTWKSTTNKQEQPLVLNAAPVSEYNNATWEWVFSSAAKAFNGYELTPHVGEIFVANGRKLIGNSLGYDPGDMESNAVIYCNPGKDEGVAVQGRIVPYMHKSVVQGVPCVWFDIDTAATDSSEHLRSRENYAYIPLSKSLSISCPEYYPNPPPPFNQLSLVGTMFCNTWGNTSSGFFSLATGLTDTTGATIPVDRPYGVELGIAFDPNYGFKVQNAPGYSSDYKKYYEAYNGKWLQFVLIYDNAQFKLYLNNELRVIAHDVGWGGMPWTDSLNYLFFRQPYDGFTGEVVYFGPMYVFDRVLSEAEIAYQWNELQKIEE